MVINENEKQVAAIIKPNFNTLHYWALKYKDIVAVTMDGLRDNVKVICYKDGEPTVGEINPTSANAFDSPFYYFKQNEIVYIEPSSQKKLIAYRNEDWPRHISMTANGISIAYTLVYRMLINDRTKTSNLK